MRRKCTCHDHSKADDPTVYTDEEGSQWHISSMSSPALLSAILDMQEVCNPVHTYKVFQAMCVEYLGRPDVHFPVPKQPVEETEHTHIAASASIHKDAVINEYGVKIESGVKIDRGARIHKDVIIGRGAVIGEEAVIGRRAQIKPGAMIGAHTTIGEDTTICYGVFIADYVVIPSGRSVKNPMLYDYSNKDNAQQQDEVREPEEREYDEDDEYYNYNSDYFV